MPNATALLRDHLKLRQSKGESHVLLRPCVLQKASLLKNRHTPLPKPVIESPPPIPTAPTLEARQILEHPPTSSKPRVCILPTHGDTNAEKITSLVAIAENWAPARQLGSLRETMVFSAGDPNAKLMLIGEAPGAEEERQREPFVGPAGQKLTNILKAMGLARSQVYISNICKFRPAMENQGNSNRAPSDLEMATCLPFVITEIDILRPQIIVALGATASKGLGLEGSVGRLRGKFHEFQGTEVMVTYHPSYLLREEKMNGGMEAKRQVWEDMLQVMGRLGIPISQKQQNFFK